MSTTSQTTTVAAPTQLGIGTRFSIHPHCDDFVRVILDALDDVSQAGLTDGLVLQTDEVSTYVGAVEAPAEERLARYLAGVVAAASRRSGRGGGGAPVLLSRGCRGERACGLAVTPLPVAGPGDVPPTGVPAGAQRSLDPLLDGSSEHGDHVVPIEGAIAAA